MKSFFVLHLVFWLECARTAGWELWLGSLQESCKGRRLNIFNKAKMSLKKKGAQRNREYREGGGCHFKEGSHFNDFSLRGYLSYSSGYELELNNKKYAE